MSTIRRQIMSDALKAFDLLLMIASFLVATLAMAVEIRSVSFMHFLSLRIKLQNLLIFFVLLWVWNVVFSMFSLYDSKRFSSRLAELTDVVKATSLGTLVIAIMAFLFRLRTITTPGFIVIFWLFATAVAIGGRLALRTWLRYIRSRGRNSRNMLIVGANRRACDFAKAIQSRPELGFRIIGFADQAWPGLHEIQENGFSLVCGLTSLPAFIRHNVVDEVVMALPIRSFHENASGIAMLCREQGIIFHLLSDIFNLNGALPKAEEVDEAGLITQHTSTITGWPRLAKRILDFTIALVLLILLAPLLVAVGILVRLTSPGPALFVQKRIGLNKRTFNIHKFRTMIVNAEDKLQEIEHLNEVSGPVFKIKNDPRLTPIGRFLRKTSIDELPQLFNVLKGDMSLVGPRPLQVRDYELFTECCEDWQRCRFSVSPGITCLWQVNGRNLLPFDRWMELDLQYVRKWSFWLDLKILAKTVPVVLKGSGAA
jgi:exopolysaccharide biosynthesis polyprenyl glycosylphosphotransferase